MIQLFQRTQSPLAMVSMALGLAAALLFLSVFVASERPFVDLPKGAVVQSVNGITLDANDLMPEPDKLGSYAKQRAFFARQSMLSAELERAQVDIGYVDAQGVAQRQTVEPRPRKITDLPFAFWFQQAVGILAIMVSGWVLSLRSRDWGAWMFALTGLFLAVSAMAASVYSTRQIALPGDEFRILSGINHIGSVLFGIALVGLFMMYPRQLLRPIWLLAPVIVFGIGLVLDLLFVGEVHWVMLVISTQLVVAILLGVIQWRRARGNQVERAGMRWFFLFSLIGCSLFICLSVLPTALGLARDGLISQAYAFGFFNLMHIGLALGVVRWRVFDLDRYAYYIWLWLAGLTLIFATDLLLLLWMREQPLTSLTIALVIASFLYFPVRQFLLSRLFTSKTPRPSEEITGVFEAAFAPTKRLQDARWDALLKKAFGLAADVQRLENAPVESEIAQNGLALNLPAVSDLSGRQLFYPNGGRRLFNPKDVIAGQALCRMYAVARDGHLAYERGVTVERDRISRDVHDNIGAQLLTALHASDPSSKDMLLRETLTDLRQIISDGFSTDFKLAEVAADLRGETADRLEIHKVALDWQTDLDQTGQRDTTVPYLVANNLRSILREITSNVIKHARADAMHVHITSAGDGITLDVGDNGTAFDPDKVDRGAGLDNIIERVGAMDGRVSFDTARKAIRLNIPVYRPENAPA